MQRPSCSIELSRLCRIVIGLYIVFSSIHCKAADGLFIAVRPGSKTSSLEIGNIGGEDGMFALLTAEAFKYNSNSKTGIRIHGMFGVDQYHYWGGFLSKDSIQGVAVGARVGKNWIYSKCVFIGAIAQVSAGQYQSQAEVGVQLGWAFGLAPYYR